MPTDFKTAIKNRRTYYDIDSKSPISDKQIQDLVEYAVLHTPSSFNSQSARAVLLFNKNHAKLWEIVRETLRPMVSPDQFKSTSDKMDSFAAGHGTVLFYEDQEVIEKLRRDFPLYKDAFPWFSLNSAGMLQYVVWTLLRDAGLGASLQHYGNLIEKQVAETWNLPASWRLIAQMPYGTPKSEPEPKKKLPLSETVRVFA